MSDVTIEVMTKIVAGQPRGVLNFRDELAGWVGNLARYAKGGTDGPFWLEAYGGRAYTVDRINRGALRVDRLTVGILGGIQPDRLAEVLLTAADDGLVARFIPIAPEPVRFRRPDRPLDEALIERALDRLAGLEMVTDADGALAPHYVPFDDAAAAALVEFVQWAQDEERRAAGILVSFIGKMRGFVVRLSLVLAFLDWAVSRDPHPPTIVTAAHVGRAAHFVSVYALGMARRAYGEAGTPPEERAAMLLARKLRDRRQVDEVTPRRIQKQKWPGLRSADEVRRALRVLEQAGWVIHQPTRTTTKPEDTYLVNPAIWEGVE